MSVQEDLMETRNHVKLTRALAFGVAKGSLIDFETTGRPAIDEGHEAITLGYMEGNRVVIIQRTTDDKEPFYSDIRSTLEGLPKPYLSYTEFERRIMEIELRMSTRQQDFVDIMEPWRAKAESRNLKWPKLGELISEPNDYFNEPKISGKDVPRIWKAYSTTHDERILKPIIKHCLSDILREAILQSMYENQIRFEGD